MKSTQTGLHEHLNRTRVDLSSASSHYALLLTVESSQNAIKALIEERFDAISSGAAPNPPAAAFPESNAPLSPPNGVLNGHQDALKDEADVNGDEIKVSTHPQKKNQRKELSTDTEDADARLAALLQAEENQRTRTTRGGGAKAAPKKKKKPAPKKKSDKRVRPEDDSDVGGSDGASPKKRKAGGGFQKPFNLSFPLAELCGESQVSEPSKSGLIAAMLLILVCSFAINISIALSSSSCQEVMGAYKRQTTSRPQRQTPDSMR
jgi:hypothetical protein